LKHSLPSSEFKYLLNNSAVYKTPSLFVRYKKSSSLKIGFSISKRFGSAIERNRCKRKIRSLVCEKFPPKHTFHFSFQPRVILNKTINYKDEIDSLYKTIIKA